MWDYFCWGFCVPPMPKQDIRWVLFVDQPWRLSPCPLSRRVLNRRGMGYARRETVRTASLVHRGRAKRNV